MSLCNQICTLCPSLPSCPTDIVNECENIRTCGLVNCTEVKDLENSANDSILYCFRLSLENCTGHELCNVDLDLQLKWKYNLASNTIFQRLFSLLQNPTIAATSNLPEFALDAAWRGDAGSTRVASALSLPTGKYVVEICVQVLKSELELLLGECALPSLFPSVLSLDARNSKNNSCPVRVTSLIACSPAAVTVVSPPEVIPPPVV